MIECPICGSQLVEIRNSSSIEIKCTKCDYSVVTTDISLIYEDEIEYDIYLLNGEIIDQKVIVFAKNILNISSIEALKLLKSEGNIKLYSGYAVEVKSIKEKLDKLNAKYKIVPEYIW